MIGVIKGVCVQHFFLGVCVAAAAAADVGCVGCEAWGGTNAGGAGVVCVWGSKGGGAKSLVVTGRGGARAKKKSAMRPRHAVFQSTAQGCKKGGGGKGSGAPARALQARSRASPPQRPLRPPWSLVFLVVFGCIWCWHQRRKMVCVCEGVMSVLLLKNRAKPRCRDWGSKEG
jgi:hypothetical protein